MGQLTRREDWPRRLLATVDAARSRPFDWGQHDCALFAADCIEAMTGVDVAADVRGRYHDARSAARTMRRLAGAGTLEAVATQLLGAPLEAPGLAQRGDVVLLDVDAGPALGVCCGHLAAGSGPAGVVWVRMERWIRAWRV